MISVHNRGERKIIIPFCFTLYSELRYLWKGHLLPKDCTHTGELPDVGLGMCYWNTACSCSDTVLSDNGDSNFFGFFFFLVEKVEEFDKPQALD